MPLGGYRGNRNKLDLSYNLQSQKKNKQMQIEL